jgi:choice-of-anchor B domain-containing protein
MVVLVVAVALLPARVAAVPPDFDRFQPERAMFPLPATTVEHSATRPGGAAQAGPYDALGVTLLSRVPLSEFPSESNGANDVWGYVSPSGQEYAIIGLTRGTGFVNVSDPVNPVIVADIPDASSTWSDMAFYEQYVYNVNESGGGMQIIDVSQIDSGIVALVGALTQNGLQTAHNVFVNAESGFAYTCGSNMPTPGLVAIDLSNPANPSIAGIWGDRYAHDVYVTNYDDCPYSGRSGPCEIAFVFTGGSGLWIADVTNKSSMTTIGTLTYPHQAYCHQGWLTDDKRHILFGDEADELSSNLTTTTYVVNVEDVANPQLVTTFTNGETSIDHNLLIRGSYVFEANYTTGLRIYDLSDINNIQEVGYYDTYPASNARNYNGAWGVYPLLPSGIVLISDGSGGLFVLDASDTTGCATDSHCNDRNPCTTDTCDAGGACVNAALPSGTSCDDGDVCTIDGQCDTSGTCVVTDLNTVPCTDDGPCAPGACNTQTGFCECAPCTGVARPMAPAQMLPANRYLPILPDNPGELTALRVRILDLPPPFQAHIGEEFWVGQPQVICENAGQTVPPEGGCGPAPGLDNDRFLGAELVCEPVFRDWGSDGTVQVFGASVVPNGQYVVQAIGRGCYDAGTPAYSMALTVTTSIFGDTIGNCFTPPCTGLDGIVNVTTDVTAVLDKFRNLSGAPIKARCDIGGIPPSDQIVNRTVEITDVMLVLNAFVGLDYEFPVADPCP